MARVNKKNTVKRQQGLPSTQELMMTSDANVDRVPAQINSVEGSPQAPAALTEGEFVFSLPAIIALGNGDYEEGVSLLDEIHTELRTVGEQLLEAADTEKVTVPQGLGMLV